MTDTTAIQDRIRGAVPPVPAAHHGGASVSRFTAAGHGDALETLLEVLE